MNGDGVNVANGLHSIGMARVSVVEVGGWTNEDAWEYVAYPVMQYLSAYIYGADGVPKGDSLVGEGAPGRFFEATKDREIVWEWVNPIVETLRGSPSTAVFRAHRYRPDHPAFADHALEPRRYMKLNRLHGLGGRSGPGMWGPRFSG